MKVLFLSDVYYPRINGVSTSIRNSKINLERLGHSVHLIAPEYPFDTNKEKWITRIPSMSIPFDPEDRLMSYFKIRKLSNWIKKENFDIIHIHTPFVAHYFGLHLKNFLNIPCVETYHTFFEDYLHLYIPWLPKIFSKWFARRLSKRQCNKVDAVISPSPQMADILKKYGVSTSCEVIPTGIQASFFTQRDKKVFRTQYNIPLNKKVLLYVGRVAKEKNIEFLINVLNVLSQEDKDIILMITGQGPAEQEIEKKIISLNLQEKVKKLPYLDQENELPQCYAGADIFVFSSKTETQGIVPLEAMAQGTPVVAIAELGIASVIKDEEGALIAKDDIQHFCSQVKRLLDHRKFSIEQSKKAKKYVMENWSAEHMAENTINFYQKIIRESSAKKQLALNQP